MNYISARIKLILFFLCLSAVLHAQKKLNTAAGVSVCIGNPLAITKTIDMNFGNVVTSSSNGTVILSPNSSRTATGGSQLSVSNPGTVAAASFTVMGDNTQTYAITLPSTITVITGAGFKINVDTYKSDPDGTGNFLSANSIISVGGTLHLPAGQPTGIYTLEGGLTISVNYN